MLNARFRIRIPEDRWIAEVSRSFPDATFRLLSGYRAEEEMVQFGEVVADDPATVVAAVEEHPSICWVRV